MPVNIKYSSKKEKLFKALDKAHGNVSTACKEVGICRATFYKWLKANEDLKEYAEQVHESAIDHVENKLFDLINDKNVTAIIFYLKTQGKSRGYIEKQEFAVTTEDLPFDINIESRDKDAGSK